MKNVRFNAFSMNSAVHQSPGLWKHPKNKTLEHSRIPYWQNLAKLAERGLFDAVFLADVMGIYDIYEGTGNQALRSGIQVPIHDPMLVIPAMAAVTSNVSFGLTFSLTYEHPYIFARRMPTLDHLTEGRVSWDIVTGYLDSAARNTGLKQQIAHDDRYDLAEEYMEVVYKLWENSWQEGALNLDSDT